MVSVSLVTRWRSYAAFKPGPFIPADGVIGNCWSGLPGAARRRATDPRASRVAFGQRLDAISIANGIGALSGERAAMGPEPSSGTRSDAGRGSGSFAPLPPHLLPLTSFPSPPLPAANTPRGTYSCCDTRPGASL